MDISYAIYSLVVAWFTYTVFRMAVLLYQFTTFPKTFGSTPQFSLRELVEISGSTQRDLPAFRVVVPAFQEVDVIESTIRRLSKINYPLSHFEIFVTTYQDEKPIDGLTSTDVVQRAAKEVNSELDRELIRSIVVPESFDGYFPGNLCADTRHIGKSRGLNFTLRAIHSENERDERSFYIGKMYSTGIYDRQQEIILRLEDLNLVERASEFKFGRYFISSNKSYIGSLTLSSQLESLIGLINNVDFRNWASSNDLNHLLEYVKSEAPRFFLKVVPKSNNLEKGFPGYETEVLPEKQFLFEVMKSVEESYRIVLESYAAKKTDEVVGKRPFLDKKLNKANTGEALYQVARELNSRWMMVYDADADAPSDLMRYLAARIMASSDIMGFQGPVAPVLNYDEVHPLCKLGGLWMAFWHASSYPRLMNNRQWAHPLAGTNWCFRIEGIERDGTLTRECDFDESKRRFLLSFNPKQLTEDLEAGIRFFSDWSINAEWHPVLELEQVPPTPRGLVTQRTRWTLGTLQTISYIIRSKVPMLQKLRFVFHPSEIIVNGSGPIITISLFIAMGFGLLVVDPIFAWWAVVLTFGNLIYVFCFLKVFDRYYDIRQRIATMDYLYYQLAEVDSGVKLCLKRHEAIDQRKTKELLDRLKHAIESSAICLAYYDWRCTDDYPAYTFENKKDQAQYDLLLSVSPNIVSHRDLNSCIDEIDISLPNSDVENAPPDSTQSKFHRKPSYNCAQDNVILRLENCISTLSEAEKREKNCLGFRWSKLHSEIFIWTFPYIFFQLVPYFKGLLKWLRGEKDSWNKTSRTPKTKPGVVRNI